MRVLSGGVVLAYTRVSNGANDTQGFRSAQVGDGDDTTGNGYGDGITIEVYGAKYEECYIDLI